MSDLIIAHQLAYAQCLHGMGEDGADMAALRSAEEEAFRALLHAPLTSDADRGCYAAAVIERENGFLVRGYAGTRNDPLSVAYRNLRVGEHALEPVQEDEPEHVEAEPAPSARFDAYDPKTGLATYVEAAGTISTRPAAEWIAFMAMRLPPVPRSERTRQFNAGCGDIDGAACAELEARLTRELRINALHALMFRSDEVFSEAQAIRDGGNGAGASARKVDLKSFTVLQLVNLREAYQAARHVWEGVAVRPYSVAWRDPRGCVHATPGGHLMFGPDLVEEHQPLRVQVELILEPRLADFHHIRKLLLRGMRRVFYMSGRGARSHGTTS